jgi:hypothetical protein
MLASSLPPSSQGMLCRTPHAWDIPMNVGTRMHARRLIAEVWRPWGCWLLLAAAAGRLVGVAFLKSIGNDADNVGYLIPVPVVV